MGDIGFSRFDLTISEVMGSDVPYASNWFWGKGLKNDCWGSHHFVSSMCVNVLSSLDQGGAMGYF